MWRATDLVTQKNHQSLGHPTGFPNLDEQLADQGWPKNGLVEVTYQSIGCGELRLLVPVLEVLSRSRNQWVAWIDPPLIPYAPGFQSLGIDTDKMLLIHTKNRKDALWSLEKTCKSKNCSVVLAWMNDPLEFKETQRLQLAAKLGDCLTYLFHPLSSNSQKPSASELRLSLSASEKAGVIHVDVTKRRRGWATHGILVEVSQVLDTSENPLMDVKEKIQLWRGTKQTREPRGLATKEADDIALPYPELGKPSTQMTTPQ